MTMPVAQDIYDELVNFCISSTEMPESKVDDYIEEAITNIEQRLGRKLDEESTITEYLSGDGTNTLLLGYRQINEIISIDYSTISDAIRETVGLNYTLTPYGMLVLSQYSFFRKGEKNIKVIYKVGGSLTNSEKRAIIL